MIGWPWRRRKAELDEEISSHFRLAVEDRMSHGESRAAAESAVRREFGNELLVREATRRQWGWFWVERSMAEIGLALRGFRRSPRYFLAAWLCITVGIGATVTIFAVLHAVLLRPLPYADESGLVVVTPVRAHSSIAQLTPAELETFRGARGLARVGTWRAGENVVRGDGQPPERVLEAEVDPNLLPVLGVRPLLGRWPRPEEDRSAVVVLSYDFWQRRFSGDDHIIGRSVRIGDRAHEVIGVMPEGFSVPEGTELWRPGAVPPPELPDILYFDGAIGRLAPGVDPARAHAELVMLMEGLKSRDPGYAQTTYRVARLRDALLGRLRRPILIFQGAALLVLVIACANVAALQLARGAARRREFALRSAIGAGRFGLMRHVLAESAALALIGGVGGVLLSLVGLHRVALLFPDGVPSYITLGMDARVLFAAFGTIFLAALLFGAAPAVRASRTRAPLALDGWLGGGSAASHGPSRLTNLLVVGEVAVSVVLVAGAALLVRSDIEMRGDLGFEPAGLLSMRFPFSAWEGAEPGRRAALSRQLEERLRALPGVEAVTSSFNAVPLDGPMAGFFSFRLRRQAPEQAIGQRASVQWVAPDYARTLGARLLNGRDLAEEDMGGAETAALVNRNFESTYLAGERAVGSTVLVGEDTGEQESQMVVRIVGTIDDVRHERPPVDVVPTLYVVNQVRPTRTWIVRARQDDPTSLAPETRRLMNELDPTAAMPRIQAQTDVVRRAFWRERLQRDVLSIFAAVALVLATCSMYGVLSYAVAQRTSEFGVRVAVGASSRQLLRMVLRDAASVALVGVTVGAITALALGRLLSSAAHGVPAADPATLAITAGALLIVSVFAALVPAWRAAKLDPLVALRRS